MNVFKAGNRVEEKARPSCPDGIFPLPGHVHKKPHQTMRFFGPLALFAGKGFHRGGIGFTDDLPGGIININNGGFHITGRNPLV